MQTPATEIDQMIVQLNEFILPSSLMESFDVYREESVKSAAHCFNDAQLSWFLDMLNRFRGPDDRKDSLVDVFDPACTPATIRRGKQHREPGLRCRR
jgi:hypothetical protein